MLPEAPFLFSIAGLSASMAGLGGLVAALRRGEGFRAIDLFRLREIVEFAFAITLIALAFVPVSSLIGVAGAVRLTGIGVFAYLLGNGISLYLRLGRLALPRSSGWLVVAGAVTLTGGVVAIVTAVTGSMPALEILLIMLLARPILAFLFVLTSFETSDRG